MSATGDEYADDHLSPLDRAAAPPPRVVGAGCLARFDPVELNADSGVDFSAAQAIASAESADI